MSTKKIVYVESDYTENNKISILEKINRLQELQDPDLMDIDYLEYFADNLGYDININKSELGDLSSINDDNTCSADEAERYMRFAIRNLPLWYKIKTTKKSIRILLYSFGMIGDISTYYTNNYLPESEGGKWIVPDFTMKSDSLKNIPKDFYPTPHFGIWIDLNLSENNLNWETAKREQIVNAIESIRPANTVFRKLGAYVTNNTNAYVSMYTRFHSRYIKIPCNGDSDYWNPIGTWLISPYPVSTNTMPPIGDTQSTYSNITINKAVLTITGDTVGTTEVNLRVYPAVGVSYDIILFSGKGNGVFTLDSGTPILDITDSVQIYPEITLGNAGDPNSAKLELFA